MSCPWRWPLILIWGRRPALRPGTIPGQSCHLFVRGAPELADDDTRLFERLAGERLVAPCLGDASCEEIGIRPPCVQGGLLAGCGDIGIMEADRRPIDLELLFACHGG